MQLSGWWMFLSFYQSVIAVPLAIVLLVLLVRAPGGRRRILYAGLLVLVLLPHIQLHAGNYYFDHLCRTQAGEVIYRTVENVEGILQMRPRDGSKDYFDRMRAGDIPEDPWGHTNREAQRPWQMINGYLFIEVPVNGAITPPLTLRNIYHPSMFALPPPGAKLARFFGFDGTTLSSIRKQFDSVHWSRVGFTWEERRDWLATWLKIRGGEIRVVDVGTGELLGVKTGFLRVRPAAICPGTKDDSMAERFVERVARPAEHDYEGGLR